MICAKGQILLTGSRVTKNQFFFIAQNWCKHKDSWFSKSRSKSDNTLMNLSEDDQHPKPAIPWCNPETLLWLPNEVECSLGNCKQEILTLNSGKALKHKFRIILKPKTKELHWIHYPYPPVEAQTRAPLSNRIWTQSGRLWRAAKCKGVAPLPSLIFTNLANPLWSSTDTSNHKKMDKLNHSTDINWSKSIQNTHHESATGFEWAAESMAWRQSEWP